MKTRSILAVVALLLYGAASAQMMAMLVRQYMGRSVTGQTVVVCVYRINNQTFEQAHPIGSVCPSSVMVQ